MLPVKIYLAVLLILVLSLENYFWSFAPHVWHLHRRLLKGRSLSFSFLPMS